jgi:dTDP-6-deoxy-L-talose 4-dehydrogenase (NAD+)
MAAAPALILLTGATGFVGRQVLRALAECGCRLRPAVRAGKEYKLPRLECIESIIASPDLFGESAAWWAEACRGVDTVIHVAWYAEPGQYLHSPINRQCLDGTLRLAEGAVEAKVRRFVGIGTCFEYDLAQGRLTIETALKPATAYAAAKVEAFTALSRQLPRRGVEFACCRLFYLYWVGEEDRRLVPYLGQRIAAGKPAELSDGSHVRDYHDVSEAGPRIALTALGSAQGPVNICSGTPVTVRALAERIADEYGRRDLLRFGARPDDPSNPPMVVGA